MTTLSRPATLPVWTALGAWAALALGVSALGVITIERRAVIPFVLVSAVGALLAGYRLWPALRALAQRIDLRAPILLHTIRAPIGVMFLVMEARGELDGSFAQLAGWGDIAAGLLAIGAALAVGSELPSRRTIILAWNALGLLDILAVVANAQRILLFSDHPETMSALTKFPFGVLPLFVVPIVIATHLLVFARLRREASEAPRS